MGNKNQFLLNRDRHLIKDTPFCPICKNKITFLLYKLYDDRYGFPGLFKLYRCSECRHLFLIKRWTPDEITKLYNDYYPRKKIEMNSYKNHKKNGKLRGWINGEFSKAVNWVPPNSKVLEIGCGLGESLGYLKQIGCDAYGVDPEKNLLIAANLFNYNVKIELFDSAYYESEFFDVVIMDQVIEHVINPFECLQKIHRILKKNGTAIISTPNAEGWGTKIFRKKSIIWHTPYHLNIFSKKSFQILIKKTNFTLESIKTITDSGWLYLQLLHLINKTENGKTNNLWTFSLEPKNKSKIYLKIPIQFIYYTKIIHLITRFFDMLRIGENTIYILKKE